MTTTRQNNGTARLTLNIHLGISWRGGSRTKRATICAQVFQLVAGHVSVNGGHGPRCSATVRRNDHAKCRFTQANDYGGDDDPYYRPRANSQRSPMVTVGWHSFGGVVAEGLQHYYEKKNAHAKEKTKHGKKKTSRAAMRNATRKRRQQKTEAKNS